MYFSVKEERCEEEWMMHYTGTIWRPPYEAASLLLEVTAGCTHHRCKFCTLYADLSFRFRMSPMEEFEEDLAEIKSYQSYARRIFWTGGKPVCHEL